MSKCHDWMVTYTGRKFYPTNPNPADIDIVDIAHGLSMICRFGGHVKQFYSVAQHSVMACELAEPSVRLAALLHDATEAYIGDCIRPLKVQLPQFNAVEAKVCAAICERFGLKLTHSDKVAIKFIDNTLLMTERRDLTDSNHFRWIEELEAFKPLPFSINPVTQPEAEQAFLKLFEKYYAH